MPSVQPTAPKEWSPVGDSRGMLSYSIPRGWAGSTVATSSNGHRVAIGSLDWSFAGNYYPGNVEVYEETNGTWNRMGERISGIFNDEMGTSVSLNASGDVLAIGVPGAMSSRSEVRIFKWLDGEWQPAGVIAADVRSNLNAQYSYDVSLSDDGNMVAISGFFDDSAEVFKATEDGVWSRVGNDSSLMAGDSVALSGDGNRVIVHQMVDHIVCVYGRTDEGSWEVMDSDAAFLGSTVGAVSISHDGSRIAVSYITLGRVMVYDWDGVEWNILGIPVSGDSAREFGSSLSLSSDGSFIAIGVPDDDPDGVRDAGSVRVFRFSQTRNDWKQVGSDLVGSREVAAAGTSVALSANGSRVVYGAPWTRGIIVHVGQVYVKTTAE